MAWARLGGGFSLGFSACLIAAALVRGFFFGARDHFRAFRFVVNGLGVGILLGLAVGLLVLCLRGRIEARGRAFRFAVCCGAATLLLLLARGVRWIRLGEHALLVCAAVLASAFLLHRMFRRTDAPAPQPLSIRAGTATFVLACAAWAALWTSLFGYGVLRPMPLRLASWLLVFPFAIAVATFLAGFFAAGAIAASSLHRRPVLQPWYCVLSAAIAWHQFRRLAALDGEHGSDHLLFFCPLAALLTGFGSVVLVPPVAKPRSPEPDARRT